MEKTVSIMEAWEDFYEWAQEQPEVWKPRARQNYIRRAELDRKKGVNISERAKNLMVEYGSGRYEFSETVTIKEDEK